MLTSSSHHDDSSSSLDKGQIAWIVLRWIAGIGIGLSAWGWYVDVYNVADEQLGRTKDLAGTESTELFRITPSWDGGKGSRRSN
jgi:hypothetical protein